jgi:hypothetical protein
MWEVISKILVWLVGLCVGGVVLMVIIYIASGIQMKGWLDTFNKYSSNKFNNKKQENE